MSDDWKAPPQGTVWVLDKQDALSKELVESADIADDQADAVTEYLMGALRLSSRDELLAAPICVEGALASGLERVIGRTLDPAYVWNITAFQRE